MTRIFTDGAERGDNLFWDYLIGGAVITGGANTADFRSGAWGYRFPHSSSNGNGYKNFTAVDEGFWRIGWKISHNENAQHNVQLRTSTTNLVSICLDTANYHFQVAVNGTAVATGTFTYVLNTWYLLELHAKISDASGVIQLKVDGVLDIDYSGDTLTGANTTFDNIYFVTNSSTDGGILFVDDLAFNDVAGAVDNSWPGDGRIIMLLPNAAGDVTQLTPSTGANYTCVDERPHNSDTDYVEGGTLDTYDLYNLAASGLVTGSIINRVWVTAVARDTVANGGKVKIGMKTEGTEYFGDDLTLTTGYLSVDGPEQLVNPQTGVAWTIAELDALQAGFKVRGT